MSRGIVGAIIISTLVGACGPDRPAAAPAPPEARPAQPVPAPPALMAPIEADAAAGPVPLRLPSLGAGPADWVQEPIDRPPDPLGDARLATVGDRAAIAIATAGSYRIHLDHGVSGPLDPAPIWVGLGRGDEVLVADADGRLFALEDGGPNAAATEIAHLPGAIAWDAAGRRVIAGSAAGEVWLSSSGGRSFRRQVVVRDAPVLQVLVRPDGVGVARLRTGDGPVTYAHRGGRWKPAGLQPPGPLTRIGAWIYDPAGSCSAVLARSSDRWVAAGAELDTLDDGLRGWYRRLEHDEHPGGYASAPATTLATRPPRFARDREVTGHGDDCPATGLGGGGSGTGWGIGGLGGGSPDDPFRVLVHTVSPPAPPSAGALRVLHDGVCSRADALADSNGTCPARGPWRSAPHPLWVDRAAHTAQVLAAPDDCALARTDNALGLGYLLCATEAGTELRAYTGAGFVSELTVEVAAADLRALAAAGDGTVGLHADCNPRSGCGMWVRQPSPRGLADAWRLFSAPDAVTYRVVPGGGVVTLAGRGHAMRFLHDLPDRSTELLTDWIEVPSDWLFTDFEVIDGELHLQVRGAVGHFAVVVTEAGGLEVAE